MPGGPGLKTEHKILEALSTGPKNKVELRKAAGYWGAFTQHKGLEAALARMKLAGLVEPHSRQDGGIWQLKDGIKVCECCKGKGVVDA